MNGERRQTDRQRETEGEKETQKERGKRSQNRLLSTSENFIHVSIESPDMNVLPLQHIVDSQKRIHFTKLGFLRVF